jgi:alkanesulfonate monooxygenase SsuD/methylene tetrahydromethanopterin reductase-like flavin-dependent oxidoreductase (luciferase family)
MATFGAYLNGVGTPWPDLVAQFVTAESSGFERAWTMDNVVGPVHNHPELPTYEAYTMLAAVAASTTTIKLGTMISPCNRRHPALLAKMVATIDQISNGRFIVGMGPGDHEQYFLPWGMTWDAPKDRIARLREELDVMKLLWTQSTSNYRGSYYSLDNAVLEPKAVQRPHPPICIGLNFGKQLMPKVAARYADQVNVYVAPDSDARAMVDRVREECDAIGRNPDEIEFSRVVRACITSETPRQLAEREMNEFVAAGIDPSEIELSDQLYDTHCIGNPQQVAEQMIRQIDLGFEHLIVMVGQAPGQSEIESIQAVGEQVLGLVRAERPEVA